MKFCRLSVAEFSAHEINYFIPPSLPSSLPPFLLQELEGRKMTVSKLSMLYHIHDIIGADLVES